MKSTTYIVEITTQKNGKYLSEWRNPLACSTARLLASGQQRKFLREFIEKCFAVFDQSNHAIMACGVLLFGLGNSIATTIL